MSTGIGTNQFGSDILPKKFLKNSNEMNLKQKRVLHVLSLIWVKFHLLNNQYTDRIFWTTLKGQAEFVWWILISINKMIDNT